MDVEVVMAIFSFGSLVVAVIAVFVSRSSASAAARSAAAAEGSVKNSAELLEQQQVVLRESWVARLEETMKANSTSVSIELRSKKVVAVLQSMPRSLWEEGEVLTRHAYDRAFADSGFAGYWQELEGVQGRGPLAARPGGAT